MRWVIPGDRAVIEDDGTITVLGRGSMCINSGGEKIFPEEVEAVLKATPTCSTRSSSACPTSAGASGRRGRRAPAGHTRRSTSSSTHCRTALAGYKVPRALVLVDEIGARPPASRTTAGRKRSRRTLRTVALHEDERAVLVE